MDPSVLTCFKSPFKKVRLGRDYDGGYIIADIPNVNYNIILGCGIANDITFENDFIKKYPNVQCLAYDGSIDKLPDCECSDKIQFNKKFIGKEENDDTTNLHDIIDNNDKFFLKMDIEGAEISWIDSLTDEQMNKFEQIVIEFHAPFSKTKMSVFNKINKNHYLVHFHGNNACGRQHHKWPNGKIIRIPRLFECTYVHKKYFKKRPKLNTDLIPSKIDMKNLPENREIRSYNYPPFVHK